ncbi:hypothetical protein LWI28_026550 [Acer negundo]|uniref:Fe2OG dioxygenase domain-containing protein n=1 Tax=Acer negundo TaxID=4023 RepID=A0AAD5IHC3_ACENE|nr:hypothetical protein LWI28_026550 [Acer negundo]
MGSLTEPKIPVVDFSKEELKSGTQAWLSTSKQVCSALEEYGCFIVECNDVSLDLHNKIFDSAKELYDLPTEVKMKNTSEYPFRGHVARANVYESLNIEDAGHLESTQKFTSLMWPDGNARFCDNMHKIASIMGRLNEMVIRMVFESYGVENYSDSHIGSIDYLLRFSKYQEAKDNMALPIHSDNSFSTILYQNHVNGLEVQLKDDNKWTVYDPPSRSCFIYFAAEAFKAWSNNRIRPCVHRVFMNVSDERYTLALFAFQKGEIRVPDELVDDEHPLKYKPFNHLDYLMRHLKQIYASGIKTDYPIEAYCGEKTQATVVPSNPSIFSDDSDSPVRERVCEEPLDQSPVSNEALVQAIVADDNESENNRFGSKFPKCKVGLDYVEDSEFSSNCMRATIAPEELMENRISNLETRGVRKNRKGLSSSISKHNMKTRNSRLQSKISVSSVQEEVVNTLVIRTIRF